MIVVSCPNVKKSILPGILPCIYYYYTAVDSDTAVCNADNVGDYTTLCTTWYLILLQQYTAVRYFINSTTAGSTRYDIITPGTAVACFERQKIVSLIMYGDPALRNNSSPLRSCNQGATLKPASTAKGREMLGPPRSRILASPVGCWSQVAGVSIWWFHGCRTAYSCRSLFSREKRQKK